MMINQLKRRAIDLIKRAAISYDWYDLPELLIDIRNKIGIKDDALKNAERRWRKLTGESDK